MIVKIFEPVNGFPGVGYNLRKIEQGKAEMMKIANFGALQGFSQFRIKDFEDYFQQLANLNKRTVYSMLHGTISAAGQSSTKEELTQTAERWLDLMGYAEQPYLIVFHKDTANNHVHLVTSRIDRSGKKISSAYEHNRAINALNKAIGLDENLAAQKDLQDALAYKLTTQAQLAMILEARGYRVYEGGLVKFGKRLLDIPATEFQPPSKLRARQLKAIIDKYRQQYSAKLEPSTVTLPSGFEKPLHKYRSDLADYLRAKHGLELIFHSSGDKPAYGYSIIDHAQKNVYKGSEILLLKDLLENVDIAMEKSVDPKIPDVKPMANAAETEDELSYEPPADTAVSPSPFDPPIRISIADDVDDQQIHGMRRRRQRKARTNTR